MESMERDRLRLPLAASALAGVIAFCTHAIGQESRNSLSDSAPLPPAIHATRLDYSEFDAPEAVSVVTREEIRLAGYLEISEIFRSVPGFRIVKIGDESRVSYHGTIVQQNRRMLVTIDGRSVLIGDGQYVEFDRLPIDLEDIARVTVTRGPNGAAYGDNAFLASIDFQTVGLDDTRGISVRAGGGHNGRRKLGASVNEQIGAYGLQFSVSAGRDGGYDYSDSNGTPRDDGKETKRARVTLERAFDDRSRWRLDTNIYDSENRTGVKTLQFSGKQQNKGEFISLSNQRNISGSSRIDWFVSHNRQRESVRQFGCYTPEAIAGILAVETDPKLQAGVLAPTLFVPALLGVSLQNTCFFTDLGIDSERSELELEFESRLGPWRYLLGGSFTQTDASSAQYFAGEDQEQRSYRAFGETALSMGKVHASVGLMAQNSSNVGDMEVACRGALNWQFRPNQILRYSYARSFRIPALVETETAWTGAFFFGRRDDPASTYKFSLPLPLVTSSTRLRPETIASHSLGYFGTFFDSSATVDVKVFQETIHDRVESNLFYFYPPAFNGDSFTLHGAESEVAVRLNEKWRVSGQYSYLDTDARDAFERGLSGNNAGSVSVTYRPVPNHAVTAGYYGNSRISGNSYDRYDLAYNYDRSFGEHQFRSQLVLNHHLGGVDGIRGSMPLLSNEGRFAHLDQLFLYLEMTF
jgi:iron complex outermembrane receptor protein